MNTRTLQEQLKAAIADRDVWEGFNGSRGQMKLDDPNYESSYSCKLMRDPTLRKGYTRCKSKKYGDCTFYRCSERESYKKWLEHHQQAHPNDKLLLVHDDCDECNKLRNEEVKFMNDRISKLNNKINRMNSLAEIAEMTMKPSVDDDRIEANDKMFSERA